MYICVPKEYFENQGYNDAWFKNSKPYQIEVLIVNEKYDLHSNRYNKRDCHKILTFLKLELRKSIKREKTDVKNRKKGIGIIKVKNKAKQINECVICLEKPNFDNLFTTDCKHHFCKNCFKKWEITVMKINDSRNVSCPYCRKINPRLNEYRVNKFNDKN